MNDSKPQYTPSPNWRDRFEFEVQYTSKPVPFKLDPILERYSTQQPTRYISTP